MMTLIVLLAAVCQAQHLDEKAIRDLFYDASQNSDSAKALYRSLSHIEAQDEPLLVGYKGMANFMLAHHALNPYKKLKYFLEGKNLLDGAIERAPETLELRYLRFTVQTNAPKFLGYNGDIFTDKAHILKMLSDSRPGHFDKDLYKRIIEYMSHSPFCSREERERLEVVSK